MIVPKKCLKDWIANYDPGDKKKLEKYCGVTAPIITRLFDGEGTEDIIKKANKFFAEKKERILNSFIR